MPIVFHPKPSPEKFNPVWRTARLWLSIAGLTICASAAIWGGWHDRWQAVCAGALGAALIASVYVWSISREG